MKSCTLTFLFFLFLPFILPLDAEAVSNEEVLLSLAKRSRESGSDAVLILHNGRVIFEYRSDPNWQPIETMSITKSIVALSIGLLIQEGKIPSVDTPVYHFFPEWDQGSKKAITIHHLLNHTSGLQVEPSPDEIYRAPDTLQLALCAELVTPPGSCFFYNNKAVNILSGIVEKASGLSLSEYTIQKLFKPIGIENVSWQCDASHHDYAMAHLVMTAPDLGKIGDLIAKGGCCHGVNVIDPKFINLLSSCSQSSNPFCGYLWWIDYHAVGCYWDDSLLKRYEAAGIGKDYIQRLRDLQNQVVDLPDRVASPCGDIFFSNALIKCLGGREGAHEFYTQVVSKQLPPTTWCFSGLKSISAFGAFGQQLIIFPRNGVVAVRQIRPKGFTQGDFNPNQIDTFPDFAALVNQLIYSQGY